MSPLIPLLAISLLLGSAQTQNSLMARARENGGVAGATIYVEMPVPTLDTLAREAPFVVRGMVASVRTKLSADESLVLTEYEITPLKFYKGRLPVRKEPGPGSSILVTHIGGTLDIDGLHLTTTISAYPEKDCFRRGEEVIVFLSPTDNQPSRYQIEGGPFGAFRVKDAQVEGMTEGPRGSRGEGLMHFEQRFGGGKEK